MRPVVTEDRAADLPLTQVLGELGMSLRPACGSWRPELFIQDGQTTYVSSTEGEVWKWLRKTGRIVPRLC